MYVYKKLLFDLYTWFSQLKKRGVSAEWIDQHPNLAECGLRYKTNKADATFVITDVGLYFHINSFNPDAEDDEDDDEGKI